MITIIVIMIMMTIHVIQLIMMKMINNDNYKTVGMIMILIVYMP